MKNLIYLLLPFLLFSCGKESEDESVQLSISTTSLNFGKEGGSQTVNVYSNTSWSFSCNSVWCSVSSNWGSENGTFQVTVKENTSTSSRNQSISISYGGGSDFVILNIFQDGLTNTGGEGDNKLSAPTGLNASKDDDQIYLTWNSVSGASSYKVYRSSSSSGSYSSIGVVTATNKYDSSPLTGFNYYKVTALNNTATESDMSDYVSYNYNTGGGGEESSNKPDAPTGMVALNYGSVLIPDIRISWNAVSNATSYKVYRSSSASGTYSQIGNSTSYTFLSDLNPRSGDNYYKVKAVNAAGESSYSDYVVYNHNPKDVSPCPPTLTGTKVGSNSIKISWTFSTSSGCGTPTNFEFKGYNPQFGTWVVLATSGISYTVVPSFDDNGFAKYGITVKNSKGSAQKLITYNGTSFQSY